jgi:hypothetical protein
MKDWEDKDAAGAVVVNVGSKPLYCDLLRIGSLEKIAHATNSNCYFCRILIIIIE